MKKLFQFVAGIAIALFAIQPVFAGQPCSMGAPQAPQCVADCPMSHMGPDCPMTHHVDGTGCPSNCCQQVTAPPALLAVGVENKQHTDHQLQTLTQAVFAIRPVTARYSPRAPAATGTPLRILLQTFRI